MVANANFQNTPLSFIPGIDFRFTDMSGEYYRRVGSTVYQTMIIKSLLPWFKLLLIGFVKCAKRCKDSGCTYNDLIPKSKSKTLENYINARLGPEVKLDLQYSYILMMLFTTFVHGIALPLLFPITAFAMMNVHITEKILFAYIYKKPLEYGDKLNDGTLQAIQACPYFLLAFTYWMLGNRQIFYDEAKELETRREAVDPMHQLFQSGPHNFILVFFPLFIFFDQFVLAMRYVCYKLGFWQRLRGTTLDFNFELQINERLGNYWRNIPGDPQLKWFFREHYQR
jgi:hypothetical protein